MKPSFVTPIIVRVARRLGIEVHIEPKYRYAGQIVLPDGRTRYFRGTNFDLNGQGAAEIAKDKAYAAYFLRQSGFPSPEGEAFFTARWAKIIGLEDHGIEAAIAYATSLGFPVIVKPNSKSQGSGVAKVHNRRELRQAIRSFENRENVFLVQEVVPGKDYRIVILDGEVISAYQRLPLTVIGDGVSTIRQLLIQKQEQFTASGRDTILDLDDFRITNMLRREKRDLDSIMDEGINQVLLPNANLSTGGDAVDVTDKLSAEWRRHAAEIAEKMNLRYCGLDIIVQGDITWPIGAYTVLEVNAAPGLDHYASVGQKQREIVEQMYEKVLLAMLK